MYIGRLIIFSGNLNSQGMVVLYKNGLLRSAANWFGKGYRDWIMRVDCERPGKMLKCPSESPEKTPLKMCGL